MKYILFLLFTSSAIFSQETEKIKFNYLSFGMGFYNQQYFKANGITGNIDVSLKYKKNLIIIHTAFGIGGNDKQSIFVFDNFNAFYELNLLYGKEFAITDWFKTEGQIGVGNFKQTNSSTEDDRSTMGIPIRAKFLFYPSKKFAIGLNPNLNINSINRIVSYNLMFQFKF